MSAHRVGCSNVVFVAIKVANSLQHLEEDRPDFSNKKAGTNINSDATSVIRKIRSSHRES
jgi:hypothetical protein